MVDIKKVLFALEMCSSGICTPNKCPYSKNDSNCDDDLMHDALFLLKEQEVKELTIEEWQAWKKDKKHDPICLLWDHDFTPIWILDANDVHEPALLMGKCKLFKGKPSHEQCKAVKWE